MIGDCSLRFLLRIVVALACMLVAMVRVGAADRIMRVAMVYPSSASTALASAEAFQQRLRELGWVEGANLAIARRFADGKQDRLSALMTEAVADKTDVIVTVGTQSVFAPKQATETIPIVGLMGDPVGTGLVASLARPGGNVTGLSVQNAEELPGKWIELLHELLPRLVAVAVVVNPGNAASSTGLAQVQQAAQAFNIKLFVFEAKRLEDYEPALRKARGAAQAAIVLPDVIAMYSRKQIATMAHKHRIPVLYSHRDFVQAGGLVSYGPDLEVLWRRAGDYVDRILRGANPADLPIEQPTRFELVVNLDAAKDLGLAIPDSILLRADKVILKHR